MHERLARLQSRSREGREIASIRSRSVQAFEAKTSTVSQALLSSDVITGRGAQRGAETKGGRVCSSFLF